MSIQSMVDMVRLEVDDQNRSRWPSDDTIKMFLQRAIERIGYLLIKNEIEFARESMDVMLATDGKVTPFDYDNIQALSGLYRNDTMERLVFLPYDQWFRLLSAGTAACWTVNNGEALFKRPGTQDIPATLVFYPKVTIDAVDSPWGGRVDEMIVEYAAFRAKNVDEMNLQQDTLLLKDIEDGIMATYKRLGPQHAVPTGWNQ